MAVTVTASECWDLAALEEIRLRDGIAAVRAAMEAGDVGPGSPGPGGAISGGAEPNGEESPEHPSHAVVFANGFAMSRYAETGAPGAPVKHAPRHLWHASPGSSGST